MSHLGALITPYVDGELSPAQEAAAIAHLQICPPCQEAVVLERAACRRTQQSARGVQASPELTARLLAMPAGPMPSFVPDLRPRRAPFLMGGGAALVGLFVLTLVVLGGPRPDQHPSALLAATADADDVSPASLQTSLAGWVLPAEDSVDHLGLIGEGDEETLDVVVETAAGQVRMLERVGTLDPQVVQESPTATVAGHLVYLVDGWYVLESGTCVVAVLGETTGASEAVIAQLPAPDPGGFVGRVLDGWHVLAG